MVSAVVNCTGGFESNPDQVHLCSFQQLGCTCSTCALSLYQVKQWPMDPYDPPRPACLAQAHAKLQTASLLSLCLHATCIPVAHLKHWRRCIVPAIVDTAYVHTHFLVWAVGQTHTCCVVISQPAVTFTPAVLLSCCVQHSHKAAS